MSALVRFEEMPDGGLRALEKMREKGKPVRVTYVDPERVSMVVPHRDYTTLRVDGWWLHVAYSHDETLRMLGRTVTT